MPGSADRNKLPYGYTQYGDLTMRASGACVPVMLIEVDRVTEPVDELVAKLRRYTEWFDLLAPKAARRERGAVHAFRLWSRRYPPTGREGYPPVAFMFTGTLPRSSKARCGVWSTLPGPTSPAPRTRTGASPPSTTTGRCRSW